MPKFPRNHPEQIDVSLPILSVYAGIAPFLVPAILMYILFFWRNPDNSITSLLDNTDGFDILAVIIVGLLLIVLHELIHAAGWGMAAGLKRKEIAFGCDLKTLTPYAHARVPMSAKAYRIGAIAPAIVLGFIPFAVAAATGDTTLAVIGVVMVAVASGDFLGLWIIRKIPSNWLVQDHPSKMGCFAWPPPHSSISH